MSEDRPNQNEDSTQADERIRGLMSSLAGSAPAAPTFAEITQGQSRSESSNVVRMTAAPTGDADKSAPMLDPYVVEQPTDQPRRVKPLRYMAAMVGFVLIAAGGVFAYSSSTGDDGAATPEAAVETFIDNLFAADVAGVLETLPPNERVILRESLQSLKEQTDRLGLTDNLDLSNVSGVDIEADGPNGSGGSEETSIDSLRLSTESLGESVSAVTVDGTLRSSASGELLPLGPVARDLFKDALPKDGYQGVARNIDRVINDNPVRLVTVKADGGWHVSVWYTIAEYIRRDTDRPLPNFGQSTIVPTGAESPEAAVKALIAAGGRYDYAAEIALATPDESQVLYDYGPTLIAGWDASSLFRLETKVELKSEIEGDGDRRTVVISGWDIERTYPASYFDDASDGGNVIHVSHTLFDGKCQTQSFDSPENAPASEQGPVVFCRSDLSTEAARLAWDLRSTSRIVVERVDGRWFVSPIQTMVGQTVERLEKVSNPTVARGLLQTQAEIGTFTFLFDPLSLVFGGLPGFDSYYFEEHQSNPSLIDEEPVNPVPATTFPAPATPTTRPGG